MKVLTQDQDQYLDYLIDPSCQGVNKLFALTFENNADKTGHSGKFLPTVEVKDYNVLIDGGKVFDQPIKNDIRTYQNNKKIAAGQRDDYTIVCLLGYLISKKILS